MTKTEGGSHENHARYAARAHRHTALRDEQRRTSKMLARLRLATFLPAFGSLIWWLGFGGGLVAGALGAGLFFVFGTLVVIHARVEARAAWFDALREVNARGISRVERHWDALPAAPPSAGLEVEGHPYAVDLDLFGRASLFQWIGPAATTFGSRTLGRWLLASAAPAEVDLRQRAIEELSTLADWREHLAAFGVAARSSREESIETFLRWAGSSRSPLPAFAAVRIIVYAIVGMLWTLLLLHLTGVMPNSLWGLPLIAGVVLSFFTAAAVSKAFEHAGAGERTISQYAGILAHIDSQRFSSARLTGLTSRLTVAAREGVVRTAPAAMHGLNRILGFADLRSGSALFHFPIQASTLWDFHCLFALERWRRSAGPRVRDWLEAAGELDALACLAGIRHDNPDWCFPLITTDRLYAAKALGHPLLPVSRRVTNDVQLGPPGTVLLVTGSNMSGKSTLLRAIGVNAVLAAAGSPVCASSLRLPSCDVQTSIRIQDSLERGISYFMAALARLKGVVDAAERDSSDGRVLLYLLDEILQGTNSAERGVAVQAVATHLLDAGAIGAMTTHDLNLAGEEPLESHARLVHFTEIVDAGGVMTFDYQLREGLATSRNALRLMQLIGIRLTEPGAR